MKNAILFLFVCFPLISFAQQTSIIDAPVGLLRAEPEITAPIIFRIDEKAKVEVLEKTNHKWSKVSYQHDKKLVVGYITSQTLAAKEEVITVSTEIKK